MVSLKIFSWLFLGHYICMFTDGKTINFCNRQYIQKTSKVYLKDEMLNSTMIQVTDKKTGKFAFGYFKGAIRNDTNFIFSKIVIQNDTIINHTYRRYKITQGIDSSISTYLCTKKGLLFHTHQSYWNGALHSNKTFNKLMNEL